MTQTMILLLVSALFYPDVSCKIFCQCYHNVASWEFYTFLKYKCWLQDVKYYKLQLRRVRSIDISTCVSIRFRMIRTAKVSLSSKRLFEVLAQNKLEISDLYQALHLKKFHDQSIEIESPSQDFASFFRAKDRYSDSVQFPLFWRTTR